MSGTGRHRHRSLHPWHWYFRRILMHEGKKQAVARPWFTRLARRAFVDNAPA